MIFLAEASATPDAWAFWQVCASLAFLVGSAVGIFKLILMWRELRSNPEDLRAPQPFITREHVEHAKQPELDRLSTAVQTLTQTVNTNHTSIILAGGERENAIKEMVRNEVGAAMRLVSELKDSLHHELSKIRERIASAETRLDKSDS